MCRICSRVQNSFAYVGSVRARRYGFGDGDGEGDGDGGGDGDGDGGVTIESGIDFGNFIAVYAMVALPCLT